MNSPIHPPAHVPSEQEHEIAYLKWCLNQIVWEHLLGVDMARKGTYNFTKEAGDQDLTYLLNGLFGAEDLDDDDDEEPWERMYPYPKFRDRHIEALADIHCGDCTAVPASCMRCHAEDLYGITSTVTWKGKHEGWRLYNQWLKANKEQKDD